jgi:general secretion pathway protein C
MQLNSPRVWAPRLSAFAVAALLAASGAYWVLHWPDATDTGASLREAPVAQTTQDLPAAESAALAHLLGSDRSGAMDVAPSGQSGRLILSGVVSNVAGSGAALISVDGKPARSYAVGSRVADGLVLKAVAPRRAMLAVSAEAPVSLTLEMKPPVP